MCTFRSVFNITLWSHTLQVPCSSIWCYFFMCTFRSVFTITLLSHILQVTCSSIWCYFFMSIFRSVFITYFASPMYLHLMLLLHVHFKSVFIITLRPHTWQALCSSWCYSFMSIFKSVFNITSWSHTLQVPCSSILYSSSCASSDLFLTLLYYHTLCKYHVLPCYVISSCASSDLCLTLLLPHTVQVPCSSIWCYSFMSIFRSVFIITLWSHTLQVPCSSIPWLVSVTMYLMYH